MRHDAAANSYVNDIDNRQKFNKILYIIIILILAILCVVQYINSLRKSIKIDNLTAQNEALSNELQEKDKIINNLEEETETIIDNFNAKFVLNEYNIKYQIKVISDLKSTNDELDKQLKDIANKNKKLNKIVKKDEETIKELSDRVNTFERYEYALYYGNKRNDLTYDQIKLGEELMEAKGYDPDLLFGIIMVESRGLADVVNPTSNATGYGQFLSGTGKFIYERVLGEGRYNHSITPKDGDTNIRMMVAYLDLLYDKYNGDIVKTIKEYCGSSDYTKTYSYMNKINSHIKNKNVYDMSVKK